MARLPSLTDEFKAADAFRVPVEGAAFRISGIGALDAENTMQPDPVIKPDMPVLG